jgi:AcrR family transcriptional regulator
VNAGSLPFIDHVIEQAPEPAPAGTRAAQREATRHAIVAATARCLVEDGYAGLTTRRVADLAGVAQSTLMHHFPTRESLLVEAVTHLAMRLADDALDQLDLAALRSPRHREAVVDQAWRVFSSPQAVAAAQLWMAAWSEPELAATLRELEQRVTAIVLVTARALFPDQVGDPNFPAMLDAAVSLIRGLVSAIPISGRDQVDARWEAIKPLLLRAASELLD